MRTTLFAALLFLTGCAISPHTAGEVVVEADEYNNTKVKRVMTVLSTMPRVELNLSYLESPELEAERARLLASAPEGEDTSYLEREPTHMVRVTRTGPRWHWLKCHRVDLLADGASHSPEEEHDGSVLSESVIEHVSFELPESYVKKLALADESKLRICGDEFILSGENKTHIGRYYTTSVE